SRRRHTRSDRDWSSDVCSSDLARAALALGQCNDPAAVPVLIELLGELPAGRCTTIEQFLQGLAGDWSPDTKGSGDDAVARKIRQIGRASCRGRGQSAEVGGR